MASDTKTIRSIEGLRALFPPDSIIDKTGVEWSSPAPFDPRYGDVPQVYEGRRFYGEDRFIWLIDQMVFIYRSHPSGGNRRYTLEQVVEAMGATLDSSFDTTPKERSVDTKVLGNLWARMQVVEAHALVDRVYWSKYGFTDEAIDRFKLGRGVFHQQDGSTPLIPAKITLLNDKPELNAYYMFSRGSQGWLNSVGSKDQFIWLVQDDPASKVVAIAEGPKDVIAAWCLGFKNVTLYQGSGGFSENKVAYLRKLGYETLVGLTDNDDPGRTYKESLKRWAQEARIWFKSLAWPAEFKNGYDLSDLTQDMGLSKGMAFIQAHLEESPFETVEKPRLIDDYKTIQPLYQAEAPVKYLTREEVRGTGPNSIAASMKGYIQSSRDGLIAPTTHLIAAPAGSGKTHAAVEVVEAFAAEQTEYKMVEHAKLQEEILGLEGAFNRAVSEGDEDAKARLGNKIERVKEELQNYSWCVVSWFGQYKSGFEDLLNIGADPSLWFNFEARSPVNCENHGVAEELGRKNHDVSAYCQHGCPFKDNCKQNGYMRQFIDRKKKPITFYRHPHLVGSNDATEDCDLVVIDENPHKVVDSKAQFVRPDNLNPSRDGWGLDIPEAAQVAAVELLAAAIRQVLVVADSHVDKRINGQLNPEAYFSGSQFLHRLDWRVRELSKENYNLSSLLDYVDESVVAKHYQPSYLEGDRKTIYLRCMPQLLATLRKEISTFGINYSKPRNTVFHVKEGILQYYPAELPSIKKTIPLVLLDATPEPEIYKLMFRRPVQIYKPDIRNFNAKTVVITGSDYTRAARDKHLKIWWDERKKKLRAAFKEAEDKSTFLRKSVPLSESLMKNPITSRLIRYIETLYSGHQSMLVVTFKDLRELLEDIIVHDSYPDYKFPLREGAPLGFGHYGALRGTNEYKGFEAVLLIGAYRVPYSALWEQAQVWLWLAGMTDVIPDKLVLASSPYEGTNQGHTHWSFNHPFAARFVWLTEVAEVRQCAARIRAHSGDEHKTIYVMANRPLLEYVDRVVSAKAFFLEADGEDKPTQIKKFIAEYAQIELARVGRKRYPTYKYIADRFSVSNMTVAQIMKEIKGA